jgi:PKD repeat protein
VVDANLSTDRDEQEVHAGNRRPTACLTVPAEARTDEPVTFDASCSTDDELPIPKYDFDFGDGADPPATEVGVVEHTYRIVGTYRPTLVVTDQDGVSSMTLVRTIRVVPTKVDTTPPTVSLSSPLPNDVLTGPTTLRAIASDDGQVIKVSFYLDGSIPIGDTTTSPYALDWDPSPALNGPHTLEARAVDDSNNVGRSSPVPIQVRR